MSNDSATPAPRSLAALLTGRQMLVVERALIRQHGSDLRDYSRAELQAMRRAIAAQLYPERVSA